MSDDAIVIEIVYPHPIRRVWQALSDSEMLARWLMPNTFKPEIGHSFTFNVGAPQGWSGVVNCRVVELVPPFRVAFTWTNSALPETLVTFTLMPVPEGTRLRLEHSGFAAGGATALTIRDILASGWNSNLLRERLPQLVDQLSFAANKEPLMNSLHIKTVTVYVKDQDAAVDFYVNKLGFEKTEDTKFGEFRWVVVTPPGSETGIVLGSGFGDPNQKPGQFTGLVVTSDDVQATYNELVARGVQFSDPLTAQPWGGMQAIFNDSDGNGFVLHS